MTKTLSTRISNKLYKKFRKLAGTKNTTPSSYMRALIRNSVQEMPNPDPKSNPKILACPECGAEYSSKLKECPACKEERVKKEAVEELKDHGLA